MPEIKLDSMPFGLSSIDKDFEMVGGQIAFYTRMMLSKQSEAGAIEVPKIVQP